MIERRLFIGSSNRTHPVFENMAVVCVSITEEWIREKLHIQHRCLADVRSLSLPGTYEGKICHLGSSLKNFVRLKVLDLSYNALLSLQGVQHLKLLEILNVYYNRVSSLVEVQLLCQLKALREVDLRLNPISQRSTDYRLLLVHALPLLRSIDDCPVRDRERRACIMHFSSDVTFEPLQPAPGPDCNPDRSCDHNSGRLRIALVNQMTKTHGFLDDSDEAVLNLVAKSNLRLREPVVTNKEPRCQMYSLQDNLGEANDKSSAEDFLPSRQGPAEPVPRRFPEERGAWPLGVISPGESDIAVGGIGGSRVPFTKPWRKGCSEASKGEGQKTVQIHAKTPAEWNFTVKPEDAALAYSHYLSTKTRPPNILGARCKASCASVPSSASSASSRMSGKWQPEGPQTPGENNKLQEATISHSYGKCLAMLLELVEEHWDGKGSLQSNHSFLVQAAQILSNMEQDGTNPHEGGTCMKENVPAADGPRQREKEEEPQSEMQDLHRCLEEARYSIEELNKQLTDTLEENLTLQKQLIKSEQRWLKWQMSTEPQFIEDRSTTGGQRKQVEGRRETVQLAGKGQQLADMLQESHRSLLVTNERLLSELAETKARHREELQQLRRMAGRKT